MKKPSKPKKAVKKATRVKKEQGVAAPELTEKEKLTSRLVELESLYKELERENVRSISDLEVKIARVRKELEGM